MKKLLPLLTLCIGLCCVSCYDDSPILERLDALEKTAIASINEQISAIKSSLTSLETVDKELKATIQSLEAKGGTLQSEIEGLKTKLSAMEANDLVTESEIASLKLSIQALEDKDKAIIEELEDLTKADSTLLVKVDDLTKYLNDELTTNKNWANATFSTLEQHDSLCVVLVGIETSINNLEKELSKALSDAISESEESIKRWVNEQLTGYWTIAETEAKLDTLKANHDTEIASIKEELKTTADDLTTAYKDAIAEAIEDSEGRLSTKIDDVNTALEKKISDIEARLAAVEEKLKDLTREFAIVFDDNEVGILAGGTTSVGYTITGATDKTTVKALGQNGWSAKVTPNGTDKGTITVTAPNPMSNDEIIVLVYDGEFRTIMSTINFVTGVVTPSQTAVELEAKAGTVEITVTSNLNYKISIPEDAMDWLSVVETKSTKTETITFAYNANEFTIRHAEVTFCDDADNVITKVSFIQQGSATEVTLTEAGTLLEAIGEDVYQSIKTLIINGPINGTDVIWINRMSSLQHLDLSNTSIVEGGNAYKPSLYTKNNCIGEDMFQKMKFKEVILPNTVTSIEYCAFASCAELEHIVLGNNLSIIGKYAFYRCNKLKQVDFNENLEIIDENAFSQNKALETMKLPKSVTTIKSGAFSDCSALRSIVLSENLTYIGNIAFRRCSSLSTLCIPSKVNSIISLAFYNCENLKELHIKSTPETLTNIGSDLVSDYSNVTLYIPHGTKDKYVLTDLGRFTNIVEE